MPMYQYLCLKCGKNFSIIQKYDEKGAKCECGSHDVVRKISAPTVIFKGKDFYCNNK